MEQGSEEWHEIRRKHIGASDVPIIMGVSTYEKTRFQLWEEKLGLREKQFENGNMRFGNENEEAARIEYEKFTGNLVLPDVIFHPTIPYLMASLDGITMDKKIILEIKNTNRKNHELAKNGQIPQEFYPQLQTQLDCKPGTILHYWSFHKKDGVLVEIEKDVAYIGNMLQEIDSFWGKIVNFDPPELCEKDYVDHGSDWHEEEAIIMMAKEWEKRAEIAKASIRAKCGSQSGKGSLMKCTRSFVSPPISYKKVVEDHNIDVTPYKKEKEEKWRITEL